MGVFNFVFTGCMLWRQCTKTAQQLGEKPAQGMNAGILYLMAVPYCIVGFIGYRWWKAHQNNAI